MPQKNARNKSGRRAPYLFMALAMLLLLALIFLGVRALNAWNAYEKAAAITPTPSPTVRPVSVTTPPDFVTYTPAPSPTLYRPDRRPVWQRHQKRRDPVPAAA